MITHYLEKNPMINLACDQLRQCSLAAQAIYNTSLSSLNDAQINDIVIDVLDGVITDKGSFFSGDEK